MWKEIMGNIVKERISAAMEYAAWSPVVWKFHPPNETERRGEDEQ
jgi:hypothetical protein